MSGGYRRPPADAFEDLVERTVALEQRIYELEAPTGTQVAETVSNQAFPSVATSSGTAFAVTTGGITAASASVAVPDGFTRALVTAIGSAALIYQWPSSSGIDDLSAWMTIDGSAGPVLTMRGSELNVSGFDAFRAITPHSSRVISGLSGGSIVVNLRLQSSTNNWSPSATNRAIVTVSVMFLR